MTKTRKAGHLRPHESVSEWEKMWIGIYASEGFCYKLVAAFVYGLRIRQVTSRESERVGRIARSMGLGCNQYRRGVSESALERLDEIHRAHDKSERPLHTGSTTEMKRWLK